MRVLNTHELPALGEQARAAGSVARLCFPIGFALFDSVALIGSATAAHLLPGSAHEEGWQGFLPGTDFVFPLIFWSVSLASLYVFGFYDRLRTTLRGAELSELYAALAVAILFTMAASLFLGGESSIIVFTATWLIAAPTVALARILLQWSRRQVYPASTSAFPVLVLGGGEEAERLMRRIDSVPELDLVCVRGGAEGSLNSLEEVREFVQRNGIRYIAVATSREDKDFVAELADYCHENGLRVAWLQPTTGLPMAVSSLHTWDGTPVIHFSEPIAQRYYEVGKRLLDLAFALLALPFLLPLFLVIALAVKLDSPGPLLLGQRRIGRGGRVFDMYKFRSMRTTTDEIPEELRARNEATGPMFKIRADPRITRVGRFLRRLSLDELPQILNVLRGDMSLVGPRPPLPREIPGYDALQRKRLMVKPGITGLWQVSGRSNLTFKEMLELDVRYIQKRSLLLDVIILARTLPCVVSGRGAC